MSSSRWRESGLDSGEPVEEELQTPVGVLIDLVHDELGIGMINSANLPGEPGEARSES